MARMAGGTLGWNYQIGQLVLGIEGDYDWQNVSGSPPPHA